MKSIGAALIAAALALMSCREATPAKSSDQPRPELHLLTALPLIWGEQFGLDQPRAPVIAHLERAYRIAPIDLPSQLPEGGLLLAAQPRALPAEELVALDSWVRRGGRLMLFADPMLEWPSERMVGDPLRAPVAFPDTGLLHHWGLQLDAPDERGPRQGELDDFPILTASPGRLAATELGPAGVELAGRAVLAAPPGRQRRGCTIDAGGLAARCGIGKGVAVIIADADFLNVAGPSGLDGPTANNLAALESELRSLSR